MDGNDLIDLAERHLGETYILGARVPLDNARWKGPWDCAEFISWVTFQATGLVLGCTDDGANPATAEPYSGSWARDAAHSPRMIGIGQARDTAGAILVRKPGPNGIGHVVFSKGDGSTVEAHSHARGVTNDTVDGRRWDLAMLLPLVGYPGELPAGIFTPPAAVVLRLTNPPMSGDLVKRVQTALKRRGFAAGDSDGVFGPHTDAAVRAFQLTKGLAADGEVGPRTMEALGL
ncbi:MAG: peptidoglycan-binding domain-containing protein [Amaricoccus sp.]